MRRDINYNYIFPIITVNEIEYTSICSFIFPDFCDSFSLLVKRLVVDCSSWLVFFLFIYTLQKVQVLEVVYWKQLSNDIVKLNSDGCSKGNPRISVANWVLRDVDGNFFWAFSCYFDVASSVQTEANALQSGVNLPCHRIILKSIFNLTLSFWFGWFKRFCSSVVNSYRDWIS